MPVSDKERALLERVQQGTERAVGAIAWIVIMIIGFGIFFLGASQNINALIAAGAAFLVLGFATIALLTGAVNGIFQTSLYHFATTGDAGPFIDTEAAREAFLTQKNNALS